MQRVWRDQPPTSALHLIAHVSACASYKLGSVSFMQVVKAGEPACSVILLSLFFGRKYSKLVWLTLIPIVGGVAVGSTTELNFSLAAFLCAMTSNIASALRGVTSKDLQEETRRAKQERDKMDAQIRDLEEQIDTYMQKEHEAAKRESDTRKQSQKVQKETYKFVKEVRELNEKNAELEEKLAELNEALDNITKDRLTMKEELEATKATLANTERIRNDLDIDVAQQREKIAELTLREEDRSQEHEDMINEVTEKVKKLQSEKQEKTKSLQERDAELRQAQAQITEFEKRIQGSEQEQKRQQLEAQIREEASTLPRRPATTGASVTPIMTTSASLPAIVRPPGASPPSGGAGTSSSGAGPSNASPRRASLPYLEM